MSKEIRFFIYLLERYAEHHDVTADVAYNRLAAGGLVDYAIDMYELYHVEALENAFDDLDRRLAWSVDGKHERSEVGRMTCCSRTVAASLCAALSIVLSPGVAVAAPDASRLPMDWAPVQTNAIAKWKTDNRAPEGVVVDKAARTVRVLMEATGLSATEPAEFFAIGPLSDRAYESVFVTVASPAAIAAAMAEIGVPQGVPPEPLGARPWPQGEKVVLSARTVGETPKKQTFADLLSDKRPEEGLVLNAPVVYTGGRRDGAGTPVAATNIPCAVFALYTSGQSLFQLDGAFDQSSVYGRFCAKEAFPAGGLFELELAWDGVSRIVDRTVDVTAENVADVLKSLRAEAAKGRDIYARVAFGPSVTVAQAEVIAKAFSLLDGKGIKMNGAAPGQFPYPSFLPDAEWRARAGRIFQPFEIRVAADGTRTFTFVEEDWSGDGLDPVLKPRTMPFKDWRDVLPLVAQTGEQGAKVNVAFIFAPKMTPVATLSPIVAALTPRISTFYVFGEE